MGNRSWWRRQDAEPPRFVRVVGSLEWAAVLTVKIPPETASVIVHPPAVALPAGLRHDTQDLLVIAFTSCELIKTLELLVQLKTARPSVRTVVVGADANRYRWELMEVGAIATFGYAWEADRVARLIRRHFQTASNN